MTYEMMRTAVLPDSTVKRKALPEKVIIIFLKPRLIVLSWDIMSRIYLIGSF